MNLHSAIIAAVFATYASVAFALPQWVMKNTQFLAGDLYTVVCSGTGPGLNEARDQALNQCNILASRQLGSSTKVKSLTIETETQAGLHQEISTEIAAKNLTCKPLNEEAEYGAVSVKIYIKCQYDLAKIESHDLEARESAIKPVTTTSVSLSVVPKCQSIVIRGSSPRQIDCSTNPVNFNVLSTDTDIIVRADGYQPESFSAADFKGGSKNVFLKKL